MNGLLRKTTYLIALSIAVTVTVLEGCSGITYPEVGDEGPVRISFHTKGGFADFTEATFRACLYGENDGLFYRSGTYCYPSSYEWLTPCSADAYGAYQATDAASGLFAENGAYDLVLFSPAMFFDNYDNILLHRSSSSESSIYFTEPLRISVNHNAASNKIAYQFPEWIELIERRSSLDVRIACGADINQVTIRSNSGLSNVIDKAYYRPLSQDYTIDGVESPMAGVPFSESDRVLTYGTDTESFLFMDDCYILSMDYSAKREDDGSYIYPVPYIDIYVNNIADAVRIPLDINFKPHVRYSYNITINSFFATVNVTLMDWDTPTEIDGDISDNGDFEFTIPLYGWEPGISGEDGNAVIE